MQSEQGKRWRHFVTVRAVLEMLHKEARIARAPILTASVGQGDIRV